MWAPHTLGIPTPHSRPRATGRFTVARPYLRRPSASRSSRSRALPRPASQAPFALRCSRPRWDEAAGRHRAWWPKPHNGARGRVPQRWRPAMEHIGIDVHKVESQICILTESGEVVERRIRTQRERFAAVLGERPRAKVLIEASTESEWVARCLEELGHEVVVADPNFAPMYASRTRKVKTDRRDARALLEACRLGAYRPAHRLSEAQRHVRAHLAIREALVRTRSRYISLVRALLRREGLRIRA